MFYKTQIVNGMKFHHYLLLLILFSIPSSCPLLQLFTLCLIQLMMLPLNFSLNYRLIIYFLLSPFILFDKNLMLLSWGFCSDDLIICYWLLLLVFWIRMDYTNMTEITFFCCYQQGYVQGCVFRILKPRWEPLMARLVVDNSQQGWK